MAVPDLTVLVAAACRCLVRAAALLAVAACDSPSTRAPVVPVVDLISLLPYSDEAPRTEVIRPGDPTDRTYLLRGWSAPVRLEDGTIGARIGNDRVGTLIFSAGRKPQALTVTVERTRDMPDRRLPARHGRPVRPRRSRMVMHVNGQLVRRSVESLDTPSGVYHVPVKLLQAGRNLLSLSEPRSPRRERASDPPVPRWVYTQVRFEAKGSDAPDVRSNGDRLVMPAGSEVSFYFRAPADAALRFRSEIAGSTTDPPRLRAAIRIDGGARRVLFEQQPPNAEIQFHPLEVEAGALMRLTLAFGEANDRSGTAVELERLVIEGHPPSTVTERTNLVAGGRPNVILYLADTLRADALGCYGAHPSRTPWIDRLAEQSIVFENTVAQSPWTRPSTATILTGQYPAIHGAITLRTRVRTDVPTLASVLGKAGWTTQAFVTNLNVAPVFGFGQGFARYEYLPEDVRRPGVYEPATVLHAKTLAWLDANPSRPFFLYLHASDPHAPYRPTDPKYVPPSPPEDERVRLNRALNEAPRRLSDEAVQSLRALYDAETAEFDTELGRFLERLAALGLMNDTLLIFVADHGEEFREHGALQHGHTLYQEVMRVPLIIRLPGGHEGGRRVRALARHVDLMPTVLALLGVAADDRLPGTPLPLTDDPTAPGEEAMTDTWFGEHALAGLVVPPWKVVLPRAVSAARPEVYHLEEDPGERRNLAREHPVLIGYAKRRLGEMEAARGALAPSDETVTPVDPKALEQLRALGYVVD
jgi:arylsulfatase A-like enzyme